MSTRNPPTQSSVSVLATDLDGTFLPLNRAEVHFAAMQRLGEHFTQTGRSLVFVTGRHYASVRAVMRDMGVPAPTWIICDVGTSLYQPSGQSFAYEEVISYRDHLDSLTAAFPLDRLRPLLDTLPGLQLQESEKQGRHKLSFYTAGSEVDDRSHAINAVITREDAPFSVVGSVDPFNGDGLIDVLPRDVDKAYALRWLSRKEDFTQNAMIFAGDSGNDLAALTNGSLAVLVGNASDSVKNQVRDRMEELGRTDLLYISRAASTSGVLEGCAYFGVTFDS